MGGGGSGATFRDCIDCGGPAGSAAVEPSGVFTNGDVIVVAGPGVPRREVGGLNISGRSFQLVPLAFLAAGGAVGFGGSEGGMLCTGG